MSLFTHKPPYSSEELSAQVTTLERLHKLRDMCIQKTILQPAEGRWKLEVERYTRNIETGQRLLEHMMVKNNAK